MADRDAKAKAELSFRDRRESRALEGSKATAEYEAAGKATRDKTARLRAERLTKEASEVCAPTNNAKAEKIQPAKAAAIRKRTARDDA